MIRAFIMPACLPADHGLHYDEAQLEQHPGAHTHLHSSTDSHPHRHTAQERGDTEKLERTKAQLSLAEKSSALSACNAQREGLQADVERCGADVLALTHRWVVGWSCCLQIAPWLQAQVCAYVNFVQAQVCTFVRFFCTILQPPPTTVNS